MYLYLWFDKYELMKIIGTGLSVWDDLLMIFIVCMSPAVVSPWEEALVNVVHEAILLCWSSSFLLIGVLDVSVTTMRITCQTYFFSDLQ